MRILLTHHSDDTNMGDFAILGGLLHGLRTLWPDATIRVASAEVSDTDAADPTHPKLALTRQMAGTVVGTPVPPLRRSHGSLLGWVARLFRAEISLLLLRASGGRRHAFAGDQRALLDALRSTDVVVAKGGSYLYTHGGARGLLFLWRMLFPLRAARALGLPYVLAGVSLGPVHGRLARRLSRRTLAAAQQVLVREERSRDYAQELLTPEQPVTVIPDLAFLQVPPTVRSRSGSARHVALTVRVLPFPMDGVNAKRLQERYEHGITRAVEQVLQADPDRRVTFVTQVTEDEQLATKLTLRIGSDRAIVRPQPSDIASLMETYAAHDLVVGTRLHSTILAAASGVPVISLVCDPPKQLGTMKMLDMSNWAFSCATLDGDRLAESIEQALAKHDELAAAVTNRVTELRAGVLELIAEAVEPGDG